jgi:serine/threonine protein kinase
VKPENFAFGQFAGPSSPPERRVSQARAKLLQSIAKRPSGSHVLKLLDFDFLRRIEDPVDIVLGTDGYIAPEAYEFRPSPKSDVFAAGVLMYVLATKKLPFPDSIFNDTAEQNYVGSRVMGQIHANLKDAHHKVDWGGAWDSLPADASAFCRWLLTFEVGQRPSASEALQGAWVAGPTVDPPHRAATY